MTNTTTPPKSKNEARIIPGQVPPVLVDFLRRFDLPFLAVSLGQFHDAWRRALEVVWEYQMLFLGNELPSVEDLTIVHEALAERLDPEDGFRIDLQTHLNHVHDKLCAQINRQTRKHSARHKQEAR